MGKIQRDVAYVADPHPKQYLDFYWPDDEPQATVLFIHGGSLNESTVSADRGCICY